MPPFTQLFRHTVDQCQSLTDCTLCLTSNDPICGWCALSRVCIRDSECDRVEGERVFVLEEGQCPAITSSTPAILYLELVEVGLWWKFMVCVFHSLQC